MSYGIDIDQLRVEIIRPVLRFLNLHSDAAEVLVLGTALVESRGMFIKQLGGGPALGLWQMEPATHDDIWDNFLRYNAKLRPLVMQLATPASVTSGANEMIGNLFYGAAMCRVHYRRVSSPLPAAYDITGLAGYWKQHYNTPKGAGTIAKAVPHFEAAAGYARRG